MGTKRQKTFFKPYLTVEEVGSLNLSFFVLTAQDCIIGLPFLLAREACTVWHGNNDDVDDGSKSTRLTSVIRFATF